MIVYALEGSTAMTNLGQLFTTITGWMSNIASVITGEPLYLLSLGIFVVGAVIGLVYRLIRG